MHPGTDQNHPRPIIGVLVHNRFFQKPKVALFARKLSQANEKTQCSIFYFTPESINWEKQKINGFVLGANGNQWLERRLPFPDIIYDRGAGFSGREKAVVKSLRARLKQQPGIQFINSGKLEKWQVYQKLAKYRAVKKYLPATVVSRGMKDIRSMITKYGYIFIKISGGSGGRDVFALEKKNSGFLLRYYREGRHMERYASHLNGLRPDLKRALDPMPDQVVIQQGIRLIKYHNRLMDLRVLLVKGQDGAWVAVYNQARVATRGAVITNLCLGGEVMNYSDVYPALKARYPRIPSDQWIRRICIILARYIEQEIGSFGEMGMDLGVDETGKAWLLEANSKPSKLPEQKIEDTVGISPQFLMTLEYAQMLYAQTIPKMPKPE